MWKAKRSTWWTAAWPTTSPILSFCGHSVVLTSSSRLTFLHDPATPARPSRSSHIRTAHRFRTSHPVITSYVIYAQELLLAEKWARMNKLPFPKIDPKVFDREGLKECYVFKPRKGEKNCPTVIHFVLVNINFRTFKAPGGYRRGASHCECVCGNICVFTLPNLITLLFLPVVASLPRNCLKEFSQSAQSKIWASQLSDPDKKKKKKEKRAFSSGADVYHCIWLWKDPGAESLAAARELCVNMPYITSTHAWTL